MGVPKYSDEFKQSAVALVTEKGKPIKQVAKELGISTATMREWLARHDKAQRGETLRIQELEREVKQLRKELAIAEESVEILKKTTAILSKR